MHELKEFGLRHGLAVLALAVGLFLVALFLFYIQTNSWGRYNVVLLPEKGFENQTFEYGSWPELSDADFFGEVKSRFIEARQSFIEADLSAMRLNLYEDGVLTKEAPILSKGKVGSWWETPAGLYKVESKEKNHFSSFGNVYQPWSLAFQGNFFIHGWPYYKDGTPVAPGFSGGCIRLENKDAEEVFRRARPGMPILVFEKEFEGDSWSYALKKPEISAESYLAADLKNNYVFLSQSSTAPLPIASITKLMTALVATEYLNIEREIVIEEPMIATTSKPRLKTGDKVSVYDLFFLLLMESSNEAARAISYPLGSKRMVEIMQLKAQAIGMKNTNFADVSGESPKNISTAEDIFTLGKYLYFNRSFILKMTAGRLKDSVYGVPRYKNLSNYNIFFDDPEFVGGKTGRATFAGDTMLAIFEIETHGEKRPIAVVILNSKDAERDIRNIIDWIKKNFFE